MLHAESYKNWLICTIY